MAKKKRWISVISILLVALISISIFTPGVTAVTLEETAKATTTVPVNLREQPTIANTPYFVEIPKGTAIDVSFVFSTADGEFAVVSHEGQVGFIPTRYMSGNVKSGTTKNVKTVCAVNQRKQPTAANNPYYVEIPGNTVVKSFGSVWTNEGSFFLVEYGGKYGFVPSKYANETSESNETTTTSQQEQPQSVNVGESKAITTAPLDLRVDRFVGGAKVVMEIPKGEEVTILGESFTSDDGYEITKVSYRGNFGYVKSQYLYGTKNVSYMTVREEISPYALNLRCTPAETQNIWCEIPANESFFVLGEESGYKIAVYNGYCGFVPKRFGSAIRTYSVLNAATTKGGEGNRATNILMACRKLSGTVIGNGTLFSWFESHGQCLSSNGYVNAPVFTSAGTTQGVGGGVCQVASTINIVAKGSGMATNAAKHMYSVSYVNRQDEATVSYPSQNFMFENNTGKKITMLLFQTQAGACTVAFLV